MKIFAGQASTTLAAQIAAIGNYTPGKVRHGLFTDGEICPQLLDIQPGDTVTLVQATPPPAEHLLQLLFMIDAASQAGASKIIAIAPYLGYSRQDRVYQQGQPYSAQLIARLIETAGAHLCITCQAHTQHIDHIFNIPAQNLTTTPLFIPHLAQRSLANPLFVAPDAGAIPLAQQYAKHFGSPMISLAKHRTKPNQVAELKLEDSVAGADIILVDDLLDTGQTLCQATALLHKKRARSIRAVCTHALFSHAAHTNLCQAGLEEIIITDTLAYHALAPPFTQLSIAPLLAHALKKY